MEEKFAVPAIDSAVPGVEVPTPSRPLLSIVRALIDDVAKVEGEAVATYKELPMLLNVHLSDVNEASPRASWGPVEEATCRAH